MTGRPIVATASASAGVTALLTWAGDSAGITAPAPVSVFVAGAITTAAVAIAHNGVRGVLTRLWRGDR